jgi:hypothetical protein
MGSRPRLSWHWRAVHAPDSAHLSPVLTTCGTTSVRIGMGGRYLATSCAVRPLAVYTTISAAATLSAARTAEEASDSSLDSSGEPGGGEGRVGMRGEG